MVQYWDYCISLMGLYIEKNDHQATQNLQPISDPTLSTHTPTGLTLGAPDVSISVTTP